MKDLKDFMNESQVDEAEHYWALADSYGVLHTWTNDNSEVLFNAMVDKKFDSRKEAVEHMHNLAKRFCGSYQRYGRGIDGCVGIQITSWDAIVTHFFRVYTMPYLKNKYKWYNMDKNTVKSPSGS